MAVGTGKGGMKSRGNWNINCCVKFDCKNREQENCKYCRQFNYYEPIKVEREDDIKK